MLLTYIKPCCKFTDTTPLCFTDVGDIANMTAEALFKLRRCPRKNYAVAMWIVNYKLDEFNKQEYGVISQYFRENDYIAFLDPYDSYVNRYVYQIQGKYHSKHNPRETPKIDSPAAAI